MSSYQMSSTRIDILEKKLADTKAIKASHEKAILTALISPFGIDELADYVRRDPELFEKLKASRS